jgi:hypothetical protein
LIGPPTNWQTLRDALAGPALEMMPVYRGWETWASVVCGNGQFGLGDDGVLGITVLIKELDAYGMPLGFPGGF